MIFSQGPSFCFVESIMWKVKLYRWDLHMLKQSIVLPTREFFGVGRDDALHLLAPTQPHLVCARQANLPTTAAFFNILGCGRTISSNFPQLFGWLAFFDFRKVLHITQDFRQLRLPQCRVGWVGFCCLVQDGVITEAAWWDLYSCRWIWPCRGPWQPKRASLTSQQLTTRSSISAHSDNSNGIF